MANKNEPNVNEHYLEQIEAARNELRSIITTQNCAPIMLRLAFHDAGAYDAKKKTGGANGTVRMELGRPSNKGIQFAVDLCEQVKTKHPKLTYADIYQLAGVVAVEVSGGPAIEYSPGRRDAPEENDRAELPNPGGDAQHLRDVFHRMGFSDSEIVALSGAHTLGRAHQDRSGFDGPFTNNPFKFDNSYYIELIKGDTLGLVKFPTDKVLNEDPKFRKFVQLYAQDEKKFFEDYAKAHKKMSELGVDGPLSMDDNKCLCIEGLCAMCWVWAV